MLPQTSLQSRGRLAGPEYLDLTVVAGYLEFFVLLAVAAVLCTAMAWSARRQEMAARQAAIIVKSTPSPFAAPLKAAPGRQAAQMKGDSIDAQGQVTASSD